MRRLAAGVLFVVLLIVGYGYSQQTQPVKKLVMHTDILFDFTPNDKQLLHQKFGDDQANKIIQSIGFETSPHRVEAMGLNGWEVVATTTMPALPPNTGGDPRSWAARIVIIYRGNMYLTR